MPLEHAWIDGHLDLATIALVRDPENPTLAVEPDPTEESISFKSLERGNVRMCMATIFTECCAPDEPFGYRDHDDRDGAHAAGARQIALYEAWEEEGHFRIARSIRDIDDALEGNGPPAMVMLMECADPIRSPEEVAWWIERGVGMIGLSWSHGSRYSGGNGRPGGLTSEGEELVAAIDEAGGAHDASHLSDESLDDLLRIASGPIASSHSNVRALLPRNKYPTRHLHEDHVKEIARRGGVAGVNLYSRFLADDRRAVIDDVIAHVESLAEAFGRHRVGLGSDMDGGFGPDELPEQLERPERYGMLVEALERAGWSPEECSSFRFRAWRDFLGKIPALCETGATTGERTG